MLTPSREEKIGHRNCGYIDVGIPVDTSGNTFIWRCECKTTACQAPINHFQEAFIERENELSKIDIKQYIGHLLFEAGRLIVWGSGILTVLILLLCPILFFLFDPFIPVIVVMVVFATSLGGLIFMILGYLFIFN